MAGSVTFALETAEQRSKTLSSMSTSVCVVWFNDDGAMRDTAGVEELRPSISMAHSVSIMSIESAGSSLTIHCVSGKPYEGKPHVRFDEGSIG